MKALFILASLTTCFSAYADSGDRVLTDLEVELANGQTKLGDAAKDVLRKAKSLLEDDQPMKAYTLLDKVVELSEQEGAQPGNCWVERHLLAEEHKNPDHTLILYGVNGKKLFEQTGNQKAIEAEFLNKLVDFVEHGKCKISHPSFNAHFNCTASNGYNDAEWYSFRYLIPTVYLDHLGKDIDKASGRGSPGYFNTAIYYNRKAKPNEAASYLAITAVNRRIKQLRGSSVICQPAK